MKRIILFLILIPIIMFASGCSYWPQTLKSGYYKEGANNIKEDIDDVTGARTL